MTIASLHTREEPAFAGIHMSLETASACESRAGDMEKLSFLLSRSTDSRAFNCALRWIIYHIVEANRGITFVQLKKILRGEYGIDKRVLDTTISSLTSPTMFHSITKWRNPRMEEAGAEIGIHLSARPSELFNTWMTMTLRDFPELASFQPPRLPASRQPSARKIAG